MEAILDDILKFVEKYFSSIPFTIKDLTDEIDRRPHVFVGKTNLDAGDLRSYLDYLEHKKYIDLYSKEPLEYKINSIGKIYIKTGGFTREKEVAVGLVNYQKRVNNWLIAVTIIAAISPILTEMVKSKWLETQTPKQEVYNDVDLRNDFAEKLQRLNLRIDSLELALMRQVDSPKDSPQKVNAK